MRRCGVNALQRVSGELAERAAGGGENQPSDFAAIASVQTLMNGVVLTVDRQDRHALPTRRVGHELTRHHEHFLVRDRKRLAGVDRGEHCLETCGAR
jgi:hypothetical protein